MQNNYKSQVKISEKLDLSLGQVVRNPFSLNGGLLNFSTTLIHFVNV